MWRIAGFILRATSKRRQFENVMYDVFENKRKIKEFSLVQIAVEETQLLQNLDQLTSKAKTIILRDTSLETLRHIFMAIKDLNRQINQCRKMRSLLLGQQIKNQNTLMQTMKQDFFLESYHKEKLQSLAAPPFKKLARKALKLKIKKEQLHELHEEIADDDVEEEQEEEEIQNKGRKDDEAFNIWLEELVEQSSTRHEKTTVKDLEKRLKALRET